MKNLVEMTVTNELKEMQNSLILKEKSKRVSGENKYSFLAVSGEDYFQAINKISKESFPSLQLVDVALLKHVPSNGKTYNIFTFKLKDKMERRY